MIANLKNIFLDLDRNGWTMEPAQDFKQVLDDIGGGSAKPLPAATGSPPLTSQSARAPRGHGWSD
jgi:hypothetical protein